MIVWTFLMSVLKTVVGPAFEFLNKRVDAQTQTHIVDTKAIAELGNTTVGALSKADELMAQRYQKEGNFGPTIFCMLVILAPFVWHEWQVVLDSSRFVPCLDFWNAFVCEHRPGSWGVPGIGKPGPDGQSPWDKTEQAIFTSFFIGASTAIAGVALVKAIKR